MFKVEEKNLIIREFNEEDYPAFLKRLCQNPGWYKVFPLWKQELDSAEILFERHLLQYNDIDIPNKGLIFGAFTKNDLLVGSCGFEYNYGTKAIEVFVGLEENARFHGFGIDMVNALVKFSKEIDLKEVNANIPEAHTPAIKIFERAGFVFNNKIDYELEDCKLVMKHYIYNN